MRDEFEDFLKSGDAYLDAYDYVQAIVDFSRSIELRPRNPNAFLLRGFAHRMNGDAVLAISDFTTSIKLLRRNPDAFFHRGCLHSAAGEYPAAIADIKHSINLGTMAPDAYLQLGFACLQAKQYPAAIMNLNLSIKLNPGNLNAYLYLGYAYEETKNYQDAINSISIYFRNKRQAKSPPDPNAFLLLNRAYNCEIEKARSSIGVCHTIKALDEAPSELMSSSSLSSSSPAEVLEGAHVTGVPAVAEPGFEARVVEDNGTLSQGM